MKLGVTGAVALLLLAIMAFVGVGSLFIVRQTEQALVVRLGRYAS